MAETRTARTLQAARSSGTLALARDVAADVLGRWDGGLMGRGRWLWTGPLTAVLAGAAWADVPDAQVGVDMVGRAATAVAVSAVHLNVAAKRIRDLRAPGWPCALAANGLLAGAAAFGFGGALLISYALVLFALPGRRADAAAQGRL